MNGQKDMYVAIGQREGEFDDSHFNFVFWLEAIKDLVPKL